MNKLFVVASTYDAIIFQASSRACGIGKQFFKKTIKSIVPRNFHLHGQNATGQSSSSTSYFNVDGYLVYSVCTQSDDCV